MELVEADCLCPSPGVVDYAVEVIRSGGLVVAPTDTVYGILADPLNSDAVRRVYKVKRRSSDKPLPILLGESHHALLLVDPSHVFWRLALAFWPGPLTIVEEARPGVPRHLEEWGKIGVRLPNCPLVREIARRTGGLLVGTSANKSGMTPPTTAYEAHAQLGDKIDLYIDGGPSLRRVSSTVVEIVDGRVELLREGAIPYEKILRVLRE